ncbi:hypothetical protein [Sphingomonas sp. MS122]|uniref:hypothetical protein n=1 Tax=Sphingomonas sp. MS122 TaxID=3412683 RepID=UPI003C2B8F3A
MKRFRFGPGAALALFCAGPVFVITMTLGSVILYSAPAGTWQESFGTLFAIAILALPFGALLAAIPVSLGGFLMGWLGVDQPASRHPLVWAGAGILFALPMAAIMVIPLTTEGAALFGSTGAICALLVRYGARWDDEAAG